MGESTSWDVVIAGGGLAGQTMARQLRMALPNLSILVVDPLLRPLPPAAFKVGEATSELAAHYLAQTLELREHLENEHLVKCGLRFFFGDSSAPLSRRPEYGPRRFPPITSYQLDRGRLENHLRELNQAQQVTLWEGCSVAEFRLGESGAPHTTVVRERETGRSRRVDSTWWIDCSGRRRMLQSQLGLSAVSPLIHGACWFRVTGRCDVTDWVPSSEVEWHDRVAGGLRYRSTNHLVGPGYWVWLIPLSSGHTSVGIVVDERLHRAEEIDTRAKAWEWLQVHEPVLAERLKSFPVLDFHFAGNFSYATTQFYSANCWACSGEAAMFLDPLYSPGSDFMALGNTVITRLITEHVHHRFTEELVHRYDSLMLLLQRAFTEVFRDAYPLFGNARVTTCKVIWDNASYWVFVCQLFFQGALLSDQGVERYRELFELYHQLNLKVQKLFRDWGRLSLDSRGFEFLGYADFEVAVRSHLELGVRKTAGRFLDWIQLNLERFSAWAIVLFLLAVEDTRPDALPRLCESALSTDRIDLNLLDDTIRSHTRSGNGRRHPLGREIRSLKRQMSKLFPEFQCLQSK